MSRVNFDARLRYLYIDAPLSDTQAISLSDIKIISYKTLHAALMSA